ncbi:hypothetical protein [Rhodococcoides fascians]|uniref:hypothetical protein n=1 Tax=Rhodococcoides fascians TaxID=1828 RepID=UPI00055BC97B|nr:MULTISPECIES: hypothetical protein [Rhodococcus]OZE97445.1 hypothetical protein CH301_17935 [Rhodococcus sp. 15-1189-1-1a]OZF12139.1 hypothetical protein CH299_18630 [Rhodococcus sp. 14-2686-1-2]
MASIRAKRADQRVTNARNRFRKLKAQRLDPVSLAVERRSLTRELLSLHRLLTGSSQGSKHYRLMLQEVKAMLRILDDRPGARERRAQEDRDPKFDERRSAVSELQLRGPSSLPYRRVDAGNKLDGYGRIKTTSSNADATRESVRTVSGGLPGKGKRL